MWIARGPTLAVSFAVAMGLGASLAAAAPADALSACLERCDRARLSETNRATCRLDCEQDAATDPELIRSQIAAQTKTGTGAKPTPSPRPNQTAAAAPTPAPALTGRAACKAECAADRTLSADDRATCALECDQLDEPARPVGSGAPSAATTGPATTAVGGSVTAVTGGATSGPVAVATGSVAPPSLGVGPSSFLAMCLETCRKGPVKLSATDQATCRLTCENSASVVDVALDAVPSGWFAAPALTVMTAPRPAPVTASATGTPAPARPMTTPAAGGSCQAERATCESACGKVRAQCERGCGKQKVKTDRETCKLECGENLGLCTADCAGAYASCVNRGVR
ncbi:hypothetical protein [Nannocystis punicea]|uniref:Uncharacterized protein n=1 Tax=Nannocystis punicea TaxID=2995304 RepID=A0ABY7HHC9_9BACT|nr:hypothetical protein [Nannocystis poenicansa]WAS98727.1 hypothetical protein O0S08_21555 [Nannocystis poenicansa]